MAEHIQQEIFGIIAQFVGQRNIIPIPVKFVKFTVDYNTAVLLTQIIYWTDRTKDPEGWIYKTYEKCEEELALSEYQTRRAANNLKGECKGNLKDKCYAKDQDKRNS
jgi:hypothetical protein